MTGSPGSIELSNQVRQRGAPPGKVVALVGDLPLKMPKLLSEMALDRAKTTSLFVID
jgi:hypothetical protein